MRLDEIVGNYKEHQRKYSIYKQFLIDKLKEKEIRRKLIFDKQQEVKDFNKKSNSNLKFIYS